MHSRASTLNPHSSMPTASMRARPCCSKARPPTKIGDSTTATPPAQQRLGNEVGSLAGPGYDAEFIEIGRELGGRREIRAGEAGGEQDHGLAVVGDAEAVHQRRGRGRGAAPGEDRQLPVVAESLERRGADARAVWNAALDQVSHDGVAVGFYLP